MSIRLMGQIVLLALVQLVAGWLSIRLAIASHYASPIFLPAGIGLGVLLVFGRRLWPGMWLGSFMLCLAVAWEAGRFTGGAGTHALLSSLGIATGSTLSGLVGCTLIRRYAGYPLFYDHIRKTVFFQMLGAPVSCAIAAVVGCVSLLLTGALDPSNLRFNIYSWWVGDALGVLLVTPAVIALFENVPDLNRKRLTQLFAPLALTLAIIAAVFGYAGNAEHKQLRTTFEREAGAVFQAIRKNVDIHLEVLHGIEGFYRSSDSVTQEEFASFVDRSLSRHAGLKALGWVSVVPHAEVARYQARIREEGHPNYSVYAYGSDARGPESLPEVDTHYLVEFVEPMNGNEAALGLDHASDECRYSAVLKAIESHNPATTGSLRLVQSDPNAGAGNAVLVFHPVYELGTPRAEGSLRGFAVAVFEIDAMIASSLIDGQSASKVDLCIFDLDAEHVERELLFRSVDGVTQPNAFKPACRDKLRSTNEANSS